MAATPPPPTSSLDDLFVPPIPSIYNIPECGSTFACSFPHIVPASPYVPPPVTTIVPESPDSRGRSRSRSPSPGRINTPSPIRLCGNQKYVPPIKCDFSSIPSRSSTPDSSRSPSPRPRRKRDSYRSLSPSPLRQSFNFAPPVIIHPPPMMPSMTPPPSVPPAVWPPAAQYTEPVDVLIFKYDNNMAYAPAAKTYDEAIDNVLELWPELHEFERGRIHLFVGTPEYRVRVPKMAWEIVLYDLLRYDHVHVQVDQPPPPPQYQGDVKGNWAGGDEEKEKRVQSGGFFSSIKRIFSR